MEGLTFVDDDKIPIVSYHNDDYNDDHDNDYDDYNKPNVTTAE